MDNKVRNIFYKMRFYFYKLQKINIDAPLILFWGISQAYIIYNINEYITVAKNQKNLSSGRLFLFYYFLTIISPYTAIYNIINN